MIRGQSVIAIVPARSGSKGLAGKNTQLLCGKPLIAWSIEAGLGSQYIDEVMVSTDSEEIANIASAFGASVPFIRPAELASDVATSFEVIKHALEFYSDKLHKTFDFIVLLEPTSPLRSKEDIDAALENLIKHKEAKSIVGICRTEAQNPAYLAVKSALDLLAPYKDSMPSIIRRQDISDVYFFEGTIYISDSAFLLTSQTFYHNKTLGYEVPKWKALEIDDIDDFIMVEAIMVSRRSLT